MSSPARTWAAVLGLSAAAAAGVLALATSLHRRPAAEESFRMAPIQRIDAHQHVGPNTLGDAVRLAGMQGIRALVNLSGDHAGGELGAQLEAASRFGGRVAVFMELDLDGCCGAAWSEREVARLAQGRAMGARGLKVAKALGLTVRDAGGRVPVDSPNLEPVWRACAALSLPVAIHSGDPRAFFEPPGPANERLEELRLAPEWSWADRSRFPPWRTVFDEFVRVVERHPGVQFLGVHFGNDAEDPAEVSRLLDRLPNLWVDTAGRIPELGRRAEAARAAILAHPDRVLFGTDLQWIEGPEVKAVILGAGPPAADPGELRRFFLGTYRFLETRDRAIPSPTPIQGRWDVDGMKLPRQVLEQVYRRNAERLLGFRLADHDL